MSNKIFSTILLDEEDRYICDDGLPHRQTWDKGLLKEIVRGETISEEASRMLPKSIVAVAYDITDEVEPSTGITIEEISALSDILIVSRSSKPCEGGKKFRFDNFKRIVKQPHLEIWRRI